MSEHPPFGDPDLDWDSHPEDEPQPKPPPPRFTFGTRKAGFNVWLDTLHALGHVGDFVEHHKWKLLLVGPGNSAVGPALVGRRGDYPGLYLFLGVRFLGIDRFPDDG
jgi:hypothetical protein